MTVITTGFEDLDRAMSQFTDKVQKKYIRTALNNAVKKVETEYKKLVPVDTGAMRDAVKRRTPKRRRGSKDLARSLVIDRDRLFMLRKKRGGKLGQHKRLLKTGLAANEDFFYPAIIELGGRDGGAQRPMRAALYGNENQVKAEFVNQLRQAIAAAAK